MMRTIWVLLVLMLICACNPEPQDTHNHAEAEQAGEHGGRLLEQDSAQSR